MKLTPHFWLFARTVFGGLIVVTCAAYLWQRYEEGNAWSADYIYSLAIPIGILPIFVWFAFVPKLLEISDTHFTIQHRLKGVREIAWTELKYWGSAGVVFCLQFNTPPTFQIALFAFPASERAQLMSFLSNRFPQRKARAWIGTKGIRW